MNAVLVMRIAGLLSRHVGSIAALECAANAVQQSGAGSGVTLPEAIASCIGYRRRQRTLYPEWTQVTGEQAAAMVAAVSEMATREEAGA